MNFWHLFENDWWHVLALTTVPALVVFYIAFCYLIDRIKYRLPPGPLRLPVIGTMWMLAIQPRKQKLSATMRKIAENYGPIFTFYFGPIRMIGLNDYKIVQDTLVGQGKTFSGRLERRMPGFETIPEGVALANDDIWRRHRRFGLRAMRDFGMGKAVMVTKIQHEAGHLLGNVEKFAKSGKPFNPRHLIVNAVSNVICSLVFGKRFEDPNDPQFVDLLARLDRVVALTTVESAAYLILPFMTYFRTPAQVKEYKSLHCLIIDMVTEAVKGHRLDFDQENIRDFPDLFISSESQRDTAVQMDEFGAIMLDMFIAGTETTATALTWTLLHLTKYPEIQRKCHEAIDAVIDTDRMPTLDDRSRLVYLDAVMLEILRHVAILPLALFHSNLDTPAKIDSYDVPPNTLIMYNVAAIHHDSAYWKETNEFNPDRWIDVNNGALLSHSSHFMPFGLGPRICLGEALARVEFYIFLVAILHRFQFELIIKNVTELEQAHEGMVTCCPAYEIIALRRIQIQTNTPLKPEKLIN